MKLSRLVIFFLLVGCSAPQTITPVPTLQTLTITLTPAVQPLEDAIHRCAILQPDVALVVNELPAASIGKTSADLAFQYGEVPRTAGFSAAIVQENLVIIIHPENPIKALDRSQLRNLFGGKVQSWDAVGGTSRPVHIWTYLQSDDARQVFDNAVLANSPLSSEAMLAADPSQMTHEIGADPDAIGYAPAAWLTPQVKALELRQDLLAELHQPVLALAPTEPQGAARHFLSCLQSGAGQAELIKKYHP
jgi:hypothetical protein